jgi:cytochrome c-type biogenesis protein CcsB
MNINLENTLGNFSFILLFISMFIYWIQASNGMVVKNKKEVINATTAWNPTFSIRILGPLVMTLSNLSLFILLLLRWKASGHFPLSNLYESLMFLSWSLTLIHLIIEIGFYGSFSIETRTESMGLSYNDGKSRIGEPRKELLSCLIGSITAPSALFTNAFATFSLPKEMQEASPLVPALQSNWLMMHVTVMILSYAALILGSLLSIGFLVITSQDKPSLELSPSSLELLWKNKNHQKKMTNTKDSSSKLKNSLGNSNSLDSLHSETLAFNTPRLVGEITSGTSDLEGNLISSSILLNLTELKNPTLYKQKLAKTLDNLSYRVLGLGFPLLTIGILSGAVWANEAWGSYWSWDPKETWALLTWLVFAIYLHTRLNRGWEGKKPAIIASLGFISVWICFLGVNLIGEGLHSYGWLSNSFNLIEGGN